MCSNLEHDLKHMLNISSDNVYGSDEFECNNSYASDDDCSYIDDDTDDDNGEKSYIILKEDDLIQWQQEEIYEVTSVLSVSNDHACMLLLKYNWSVSKITEAWFGDEVKVRESVGLLDVHDDVKFPKTDIYISKIDCGICFDTFMAKDTANCGCGHGFCKVCWKSYVSYAIKDGPCCMTKKCPEPSCRVVVTPGMVNLLVERKEKKMYDMFWFRSYVEHNEKIKWCPGPGCDYAVEFKHNYDTKIFDVTCDCKYMFCWKCMEDAHSPLDCETVGKWMLKNKDEAENTTWILAYTKPCPECMKSIEKNEGCMHMTCRCGYEFCWLCLGPWRRHDDRACNGFESEDVKVNNEKQQRDLAKKAIQRYTHYYERWAANEKSKKKALSDLHKIETVDLKKLSSYYDMPETRLQFITDAWLQIVECRRMLKWTYAYGFYIPEKEKKKKAFFEFLQGEAEVGLERLHLCAEKELQIYIKIEDEEATTNVIFNSFRIKLTGLTGVTRSYFQNLVRALENGLSEVASL